MSDLYDYPPAEHYEFPANPAEAMADNRRIYRTGEEMHNDYIAGYLTEKYGAEPLFEYFTYMSRLMLVHHVRQTTGEMPERSRVVQNDFYSGTLIAMDTRLWTMRPYWVAEAIMATNPLEQFKTKELSDLDKTRFEQEVQFLKLIHDGLGLQMVSEMNLQYRREIVDTARAVYKGMPHGDAQRRDVVSGLAYGFATIDRIKRNVLAAS